MNDIKFNCPHCQQRLGVPVAALGKTISCPSCAGHIRLPEKPQAVQATPSPASAANAAGAAAPEPKCDIKFSCASCQTHIVIDARGAGRQIACQHCGASITVPLVTASAPPPRPSAPSAPTAPAALDSARGVVELIERLRSGDEQAGRELIQLGVSMIPTLVEGLKENTLEEPDTNKGAAYVSDLLVKCGAVSVQPLISRLGKSRHAYLTLGRIGTEEAVHALAHELSSCNWRRVEVACQALSLVQTANALKVLEPLDKTRAATRSGEVYAAAGAAIAAIRNRFNKTPENRPLTLQEKVAQSKITPLKALVPRS